MTISVVRSSVSSAWRTNLPTAHCGPPLETLGHPLKKQSRGSVNSIFQATFADVIIGRPALAALPARQKCVLDKSLIRGYYCVSLCNRYHKMLIKLHRRYPTPAVFHPLSTSIGSI